jgi:ABC transporter DrrB family efflux protein
MLKDTYIIAKRNLKYVARNPRLLVLSSMQPVMFLLLFNYVFGNSIGKSVNVPSGNYIDYLLPGITALVLTIGGMQTAISLSEDMNKGIIDRFRSLPMSRLAVIAGRTLADAMRNTLVLAVVVAVGYAIGFRFHNGLLRGAEMMGLAVLFGFALSWVFSCIGLMAKDGESAQVSGFLAVFPLMFISSVFVNIHTLPSWMQVMARNQPLTFMADAARELSQGIDSHGAVSKLLISISIILVLFVPQALILYRRRSS